MIFKAVIHFKEPIPELINTEGHAMDKIGELFTKDNEGAMMANVNYWMKFGYNVKVDDNFGRKIHIQVSPTLIRSIQFYEPFEHELELQDKVK